MGTLEFASNSPLGIPLPTSIRGADTLWPQLFDQAQSEIVLGLFYVAFTHEPEVQPALDALQRAANRGVRIRIIVDRNFVTHGEAGPDPSYANAKRWLEDLPNCDIRQVASFNARGGVHHAKYIVVDRRHVWIGSHNFDWRSFSHIAETGASISDPRIGAVLAGIFDSDWEGSTVVAPSSSEVAGGDVTVRAENQNVALTVSPKMDLVPSLRSDFDVILECLGAARQSVDILVRKIERSDDPDYWVALLQALREATSSGAQIRILVDAYVETKAQRAGGLREIINAAGASVRLTRIPKLPALDVPFGRLMHSKLMVVDRRTTWLGSANWTEGDFFRSRNVGLVVSGAQFSEKAATVFDFWWAKGEGFE